MGIRIDGASDIINASDGSLTIEGQSVNTTGIMTASGGMKVGTAATIHSTGQFNVGVSATIFASGNATFAGIVTATSFEGDGSALTGVAGTEITNSDFSVGVGASSFFVDYENKLCGIGTNVPGGTRLELYNESSAFNILSIRTGAGAYGQAGIAFGSNTTRDRNKATIFFQERSGTAHHAGDLVISIDGAGGDAGTAGLAEERVRFQASGHVGIGTSMPSDRVASSNSRILNVGVVTTNTLYAGTLGGSETVATGNIGIQTDDIGTEKIVGAASSFVGLYMGDGFIGFPTALNRDGGYFIATTVNAFNAGPVTLGSTMVLHGTWTIV